MPLSAARPMPSSLTVSGAVRRYTLLLWAALALFACSGEADAAVHTGGSDDQSTSDSTVNYRYQFRASKEGFAVSANGGSYKPFWPVGINFSLTIHSPGEYLASRAQILRWIETAGELGANVVRTYTVQLPEFYQELRRYNLAHPNRPLSLMQGASLLDPADDPTLRAAPDYLHPKVGAFLKDDLEKAIDVAHGRRTIVAGDPKNPGNYGRAYGTYNADCSPWLLGLLIGRELNLWFCAPHTMPTTGVGVMVAAYGGEGEAEVSVSDTLPMATQTVAADGKSKAWRIPAVGTAELWWKAWNTPPPVHEHRKKSFFVLRDNLKSVVPATALSTLP